MALFPLSSPLDALREYMSRMDIEMLDLILDEKNTYNNLSKAVFLEKLDTVFREFRAAGDQKLLLYRGECCHCFKRCQGYTLLGENSASYLDLLIKDENGEIKDIFYCSELVNYKEVEKLQAHTLSFGPDEEAGFVPDEDYLMLLHHCREALSGLEPYRGGIIHTRDMESWLMLHKDLFEDCIAYFMYSGHDEFFGLYHDLSTLMQIYWQKERVSAEVLQYGHLNHTKNRGQKELLDWLLKNEEFGRSVCGEISRYVEGESFSRGKILLSRQAEIYLSESDFGILFEFEKIFGESYRQMLRHISVYSPEEISDMDPESEAYKLSTSLRHNLERRRQQDRDNRSSASCP